MARAVGPAAGLGALALLLERVAGRGTFFSVVERLAAMAFFGDFAGRVAARAAGRGGALDALLAALRNARLAVFFPFTFAITNLVCKPGSKMNGAI
jgi:hypothetical protein